MPLKGQFQKHAENTVAICKHIKPWALDNGFARGLPPVPRSPPMGPEVTINTKRYHKIGLIKNARVPLRASSDDNGRQCGNTDAIHKHMTTISLVANPSSPKSHHRTPGPPEIPENIKNRSYQKCVCAFWPSVTRSTSAAVCSFSPGFATPSMRNRYARRID